MSRVMITNALQRKSLSVARSLGRRGHRVIASETTRWNPTAFSRYCSQFIKTPDPSKTPDLYYEQIREQLKRTECDVLYPMDDDTMHIVVNHSEELAEICKFVVPDPVDYRKAFLKDLAVRAALSQGIACPATFFPESLEDVIKNIPQLSFPVIMRATDQSGSRGMKLFHDPGDVVEAFEKMHPDYQGLLIQEYIPPSAKIDVCLLYNRSGELRASFVQKELRNYPSETGPSTVQESVIHEAALESAIYLMNSLHWKGIAEVEFILDKNGENLYFMEINPRFWASVELAVLSGVDFPYLYYQIADHGDCEKVTSYQTGVKTRWVFPGECLAFLSAKKKTGTDLPFIMAGKAGIKDDTFLLSDPFPIFGVAAAALYFLTSRERRSFFFNR